MAITKQNTRGGRIGLLLFSLPFALVGIGMLVLAVLPNLYDAVRMQSWVPVDAQLLSSDLKRNYNSKTTTYQVVANYRYTYDAQSYRGNRVGISEKSDNIGDWHQQTYSRLRSARPLRVWVNPSNPHESIFDRDMRWAKLGFYMIFVLVFGGVGLGLGWWALRKPVEIPDGMPLWQGNPAWRKNQIRSNAKAGLWAIWAFAAFWNLISSPVIFAVPGEWAKGNQAILIGLIFPLIGLGFIFYAVKRTLEWRRFGATPLSLDPFPGSIGGDVGGSIQVNHLLPRDTHAVVTLSCVYVYNRRSGKNNQTVRDVKWQDQQQVTIEAGASTSQIKFRFSTPDNLPASEVKDMPYHEWTVEVSCDLPGVDLERSFTIPVMIADSPQLSRIRIHSTAHKANEITVPENTMQVSPMANGLHLHFPVLRGLVNGIVGSLVGALFVGMAYFFAFGDMKNPPPAIFPVVFGFLGSLALLGGLYTLGNSLTVVANSSGIQLTRRIYGLAINKHIPVANIRSIQTAKGMQTTQGTKATVHYVVKAHTHDGKKINVAESLPGISAAERVAEQIRVACNLQEKAAELVLP